MTAPIIPGAEPFSHDGGPGGVLVLHGFTGNPQSMRPVAEALADEGLTVELPLWPGHGTAVEDLVPLRWSDWSAAAETAYQALAARCDAVALVGLSMGGTLACWLAEAHPEIRGIVLVNPAVEPQPEEVKGFLRSLLEEGTEVAPAIGSDVAKEGVAELAYDGTPLAAVLSLFDAIETVSAGLGQVSCPVLLFSSREDHVVTPSNGDHLEASVGGPVERVFLERSYHVATLDHDAGEIVARTGEFVRSVLGGEAAD